jgi:4-diphosphocytidyl-2-C-methyl-D-erythritol kinase
MLEEAARAKVNLYLHVVGRRADGYHLLDSLAVFPGAADVVRAEPGRGLSLRIEGPFGGGLAAEADNLVLRAARALAAAGGVAADAALTLVKTLPVASGIGGGSADAAATLRVLSRLWGVSLPQDMMASVAAGLGADVPVCVASRAMRMGGIGEVLEAGPVLPGCGIVLVNPGVAVSTPAVFRARGAGFSLPAVLPARWDSARAMAADLARTTNDLEAPALSLAPQIGDALAWLRGLDGCLLARMSGSGATCFGVFGTPPGAVAAPDGWWVWSGDLTS